MEQPSETENAYSDDIWMGEQELTELTGYAKNTQAVLRSKGGFIPYIKVGRILYKRADVYQWMESKLQDNTKGLQK